jgi:hypothetical protein
MTTTHPNSCQSCPPASSHWCRACDTHAVLPPAQYCACPNFLAYGCLDNLTYIVRVFPHTPNNLLSFYLIMNPTVHISRSVRYWLGSWFPRKRLEPSVEPHRWALFGANLRAAFGDTQYPWALSCMRSQSHHPPFGGDRKHTIR